MILVDTSVWIEFFKGTGSSCQHLLHDLIEAEEDVCLADIILAEILQGIRKDNDFKKARNFLLEFPVYSLKGIDSYIAAADIYRLCRKRGITLRGLPDCFIARIAIENGLTLFHRDKDFDAIARVIKNLKVYTPQ